MSRKDVVLRASRTLAVLLMVWALSDISYLPGRVYSYLHYLNREPASAYTEYMKHYYFIELGFLITRIVGYSLFSMLLFRGGSDVQQLLLPVFEGDTSPD